MSRPALQHQGDALDVPDEASVTSSDAGSESPIGAGRRGGALRTQSAEMMAVADAMANVAEVSRVPWSPSRSPCRVLAANTRNFTTCVAREQIRRCRCRGHVQYFHQHPFGHLYCRHGEGLLIS